MSKLLFLFNICILISFNVSAENWVQYNSEGSWVDGDSIIILKNPKRVIFNTKSTSSYYQEGYIYITTGILCNSGKRYSIDAYVADNGKRIAQSDPSTLNIETDMIPGSFDTVMYKAKCLGEKTVR